MSITQKLYYGKGITVTFDSEKCIHSGVCVKGLPEVFNLQKRPWVNPDADSAEAISRHIDKCPSGALQYNLLDDVQFEQESGLTMHIEHDTAGRRFLISDEGSMAAEMTYVVSSPKLYIIDHTFVENKYRGQGLGDLLVQAIVEYARENEIKLMPLCPFAKGRLQQNSEFGDVLHTA
ncbi:MULTISPECIES: GNAT family N-acetyltransferase [Paenibacillus]|uniref:GNAT family N-acetyltransferase n=1 Tax=Paenibacillus TaxID=44249 RepID=UPI001F304B56|nr:MULTISPECIES: GNAT family N-acetyltransferase [Paenibacillus]